MTFLRSLLFNILFFTWSTIMVVLYIPALAADRRVVMHGQRNWARGVNFLMRWVAGITWRVEGQENIADGAAIYAIKHQSAWDTMILHVLFPDPAVVMKQELLNIPVYGWYCKHTKHIPIDRSAGSRALKKMLEAARNARDTGRQIVIFPEGTRTAPGEGGAHLPGVAALYKHLELPVIPVALNSGLFWGREAFFKRPGTITVRFLPAIEPGGDRRQFMARLKDDIERESNQLLPADKRPQ